MEAVGEVMGPPNDPTTFKAMAAWAEVYIASGHELEVRLIPADPNEIGSVSYIRGIAY